MTFWSYFLMARTREESSFDFFDFWQYNPMGLFFSPPQPQHFFHFFL